MSLEQQGAPPGEEWFRDETVLLGMARKHGAGALVLPGYADLRELGRGGQGVVYSATQLSTQRRVAIKVLLGGTLASARHLQRFKREAELVARLNHPHIVKVYDSGVTGDGCAYLVMELVEGEPISALRAHSTFPLTRETIQDRVRLFAKVCGALAYAHQRAVIHRDLKPGNIMIDAQGEPRVLDFGLAKSFGAGSQTELTREGHFLGSLQWTAPEQLSGEYNIDVRSDVYSLGLILYDLLAGRLPYELKGELSTMLATLSGATIPALCSHAPAADADLGAVCATALARDPARRYQSAQELLQDLESWLRGEPIRARRDSTWRKLRRGVSRSRWILAGAGVVVLALGSALAWSSHARTQVLKERDAARIEAEKTHAVLAFVRDMLASPDPARDGAEVKVVDVLERAAQDSEEELASRPEVGAAVRTTLATAQTALGRPQRGLELATEALALAEKGPGLNSDEACAARLEMANAQYELGHFDEAEKQATLAAAIAKSRSEYTNEAYIDCLSVLGAAQGKLGKLEEALVSKREVLAYRRATKGPADMDTLSALNNLAVGLTAAAKYDEAGELLTEAVRVLTEQFGEAHPYTVSAESNLASILKRRGQHEESERVLARAHEGAKKGFGEDHYTTLIIACNRADSLVSLNRFEEAIALFEDTARRQTALLGPGHLSTITTRMNLATARLKSGDKQGALTAYRETLADAEKSLDPTHPRLKQLRDNIAEAEAP